jgi:uncharacterized protein YndB with AHSA1/START domain
MDTHPVTVSLAIKAEPEAIWAALTDGTVSPAYYYGFSIDSSFDEGAPYTYTAGGAPMITGTVTDVVPAESMTMTFHGVWDPGVAALPETVVRYDLTAPAMPLPGITVLTMTHTGMPAGDTAQNVANGWVLIMSGLKTLLETGEPLATPPGA